MKFTTTIIGLNGLQQQFATAIRDINSSVADEISAAAQEWVAGAQRDAPKDSGQLTGEILANSLNDLQWEIVANKTYAAYMEFGTKGKYQPIPGTENIAAQFIGKGEGTFAEMIRFLTLWVSRKGIAGTYSVKTRKRTGGKETVASQDLALAWRIALSILRNGVNPHPYFFKQGEVVWPTMVRNVQKKLQEVTRVSVIAPGDIFRPVIVTI